MNALPSPTPIDWASAVEDLVRQPELFDAELAPTIAAQDAPLLRTSRAFRYSGAITTRDEARTLAIGLMSVSGRMSLRAIAKAARCDHRTVAAVLRHLEANGQIPTLEERVSRLMGETEHEILVWIDELVADRTIGRDHAATLRSLFTGAGIAADKRMASGQNRLSAGTVQIQIGVAAGPTPDQVAAWEERLRAEILGSPDSQSGAIEVESQQIGAAAAADTSPDTPPPAPAGPGHAPLPSPADQAGPAAPTLPPPGGGVARAGLAPDDDVLPPTQ